MPPGTSLSLAPWLHARSPGSACSGVIRNEPKDPPVSHPRRQCHRRSLHPAGRYPKDLLAWLSGERKALRADASMATPANAPPPRVSDVSWTSLAMVLGQYMSGSGAVSSGERYPPFLIASALGERGFWKSYAAVLYPFYPTLRVSSRPDPGSAQRYPGEEPGPTLRHRQGEKWVPVCGDCERVVAGGRPLGPRLIRPLSG